MAVLIAQWDIVIDFFFPILDLKSCPYFRETVLHWFAILAKAQYVNETYENKTYNMFSSIFIHYGWIFSDRPNVFWCIIFRMG